MARLPGSKILEPWNYIGLLLTLKVHELPDVSTRYTIVKHRLAEEFLMNPPARLQPSWLLRFSRSPGAIEERGA